MKAIVIVDSRPQDYSEFVAVAESRGLDCHRFTTAEEAIRQFSPVKAALRLVNCKLPDMDGLELMTQFMAIDASVPVWLVADQYRSADERAARAAGAAVFICKPVQRFATWLGWEDIFERQSETDVRQQRSPLNAGVAGPRRGRLRRCHLMDC